MADKITGNSKESLFIKDLQNKWETTYRTQNNNLNNTEYSISGIKGLNNLTASNFKSAGLENYQKSLQLKKKVKTTNLLEKIQNGFKTKMEIGNLR